MDVFWQKGDWQKPPRTKSSKQKILEKTPGRKPSWTKTYILCMYVLLNIGGVREVWRTLGGSRGFHDNLSTDISSTTLRLETFRLLLYTSV